MRPPAPAALLALVGLGACTVTPGTPGTPGIPGPPFAPAPIPGITAEEMARAADPAAFDSHTRVPVAIGRAAGRREVQLGGCAGTGTVIFVRAGDRVLASDGRAGLSLSVSPDPAGGGLTFEGTSYPGDFLVGLGPGGGLRLVNRVDLETYVEGVVARELTLWSARPAELEAQAVAVRTYALYTLAQRRLDPSGPAGDALLDSVEDQVWRGRLEPTPGAEEAHRRLGRAVAATRGQVLLRDGRLEDARYHAACGGSTADLVDVFVGSPEGARSVTCEPCRERAGREARAGRPDAARPLGWEHTFTRAQLDAAGRALGIGGRLERLAPHRTDAGGRWLEVEVHGPGGRRRVPLDDLRRLLGQGELKGSAIQATWPHPGEAIGGGLFVRGLGRGHGVGLCQEGARDYARRGWSAEHILAHYYPGTTLARLPRGPSN